MYVSYAIVMGIGILILMRGRHIAWRERFENLTGALYALVGAGICNVATCVLIMVLN